MSREIEEAIRRDAWKEARRLVRAALRRHPNDHWLLARLSLTYYEERDYQRALSIVQRAYALAPHCPLVLWDLGGSLDMLGRHTEAVRVFRRLVRRGVESIAFGDCGEGLARARGLVADCWYRLARLHSKRARRRDAILCYRRHMSMRGRACHSIYPLKDVRREFLEYAG